MTPDCHHGRLCALAMQGVTDEKWPKRRMGMCLCGRRHLVCSRAWGKSCHVCNVIQTVKKSKTRDQRLASSGRNPSESITADGGSVEGEVSYDGLTGTSAGMMGRPPTAMQMATSPADEISSEPSELEERSATAGTCDQASSGPKRNKPRKVKWKLDYTGKEFATALSSQISIAGLDETNK